MAEPQTEVEPSTAAAVPACLLAALVPGAGHLYLGRKDKGLVFLIGILSLFTLGVVMGAPVQVALGLDDLLATGFTLAELAVGLPFVVARQLVDDPAGVVKAVTFEYGKTFVAVAGLLNVLVVLDAYDVAVGRKP